MGHALKMRQFENLIENCYTSNTSIPHEVEITMWNHSLGRTLRNEIDNFPVIKFPFRGSRSTPGLLRPTETGIISSGLMSHAVKCKLNP